MARTCADSRKDESMSEKCEHSTGTVVFTCEKFSIVHCDWGCGEYLIELNVGKHEAKTITAAELAAMQEQNKKMIEFLKKARNDEFCDNDGRGCGTGSRADDLLEEMGIE